MTTYFNSSDIKMRLPWTPDVSESFAILGAGGERYTLPVMLPWPFQLAAFCFLILIWFAQWLDWKSGLQDRALDCHFRRRGA